MESFSITAISKIDDFLKKNNGIDIKHDNNPVIERAHGKIFSNEDHLKALIYALLTNQRKWSDIEPKLPQVDQLFFFYNYEIIKSRDTSYFENGIRNLKCGNISIKKQMEGLHNDITIFERIIKEYGTMDKFVLSLPPDLIVKMLSDAASQYKITGLGQALAWEYLRNVGIDASKPDTHLKRFFGSERIGISRNAIATEDEVIAAIDELAGSGQYSAFEIDYLIWAYCATGKGEICTATPSL